MRQMEKNGWKMQKILEETDSLLGQFWLRAAFAACEVDPRTAIPNPPPIKAPIIAKILRISLISNNTLLYNANLAIIMSFNNW